MRLACWNCDTEDADGVKRTPKGWQDVSRDDRGKRRVEPPSSDEMTPDEFTLIKNGILDDDGMLEAEPGIWWTHLGLCPTCNSGQLELTLYT